jgi:hypothetical protein
VQLQGLPARECTPGGEPVMHAERDLLAVVGSVCMMLALVLAWCRAGVRSSRFVKKCFPNPQYLLKAHLDFLMMTGLLFGFFLVFDHLRLTPPTAIVLAIVVPYTHDALINDKTASETSRQAIRDVVHAVRSGAPFEKS